MKNAFVLFIIVLLLCSCSSSTTATEPAKPTSTITNTPLPTNTPEPTSTPRPTNTPKPTTTPTPVPQPIIFEGSGDKIITLDEPLIAPRILELSNTGSSNFIVKSYDQFGNDIDLLVNEIGSYQGKMLIGMMLDEEPVSRFEIQSSGSWNLIIYPFSIDYMDALEVPGRYEGKGDSVVVLIGEPDIVTFTTTERDNFIVYAYTNERRELLLNEIGPYSGEKVLPNGVMVLNVFINGVWSMEITAK